MRNTIELTVGALIGTIAISAIVVMFLLDSFLGPIFRDDLYCSVGLGTEVVHNPAKATKSDGTALPDVKWSICQHGTMWDWMTGALIPSHRGSGAFQRRLEDRTD